MGELYEFVISPSALSPKSQMWSWFCFSVRVATVATTRLSFMMLIYACTSADTPSRVISMRRSFSRTARTLKEDPSWIIQTSLCCCTLHIGFHFLISWQTWRSFLWAGFKKKKNFTYFMNCSDAWVINQILWKLIKFKFQMFYLILLST